MASLPDPDEDLLARVARGDPAAVRALMARKLPRIHGLAARMLSATPLKRMSEKVFTFFTKDENLLVSLPALPGLSIRKTRELLAINES